jgi:hypothetical protein
MNIIYICHLIKTKVCRIYLINQYWGDDELLIRLAGNLNPIFIL